MLDLRWNRLISVCLTPRIDELDWVVLNGHNKSYTLNFRVRSVETVT